MATLKWATKHLYLCAAREKSIHLYTHVLVHIMYFIVYINWKVNAL